MAKGEKAYFVICVGLDDWDSCGVMNAQSKGKAIYRAYLSAKDANYDMPITKFRARRAPKYDDWAIKEQRVGFWTREYVDSQIAQA